MRTCLFTVLLICDATGLIAQDAGRGAADFAKRPAQVGKGVPAGDSKVVLESPLKFDPVPPVAKKATTAPRVNPGRPLPPKVVYGPAISASGSIPDELTQMTLTYHIIVQPRGQDEWQRVDEHYAFHSGDHFRLQIASNFEGYIYVFNHSSDGQWQVLVPDSRLPAGGNRISSSGTDLPHPISTTRWFRMDQSPGSETLYLWVSLHAVPELERSAASTAAAAELVSRWEPVLFAARDLNQTYSRSKGIVIDDASIPGMEQDLLLFQPSTVGRFEEGGNVTLFTRKKLPLLCWKINLRHLP